MLDKQTEKSWMYFRIWTLVDWGCLKIFWIIFFLWGWNSNQIKQKKELRYQINASENKDLHTSIFKILKTQQFICWIRWRLYEDTYRSWLIKLYNCTANKSMPTMAIDQVNLSKSLLIKFRYLKSNLKITKFAIIV
jgi:hypothetical protein